VIASGLDLACLKEHRGRHTPSPSIWTRALNWVYDLGVVVAHEDQRLGGVLENLQQAAEGASVPVAVEDLRPRAKYVQITLAAVYDIRFCEKLFNDWMAELDKCVLVLANRFFSASCLSPYTNDNNGFTES
jgi:hypothetical protein